MDQARSRSRVFGTYSQVLAINICGLRLVLRLQALRQPLQDFGRVRTNFQRVAKSCLGLGWFASAQVQVAEIMIRGQIIRIEMQYSFKRSSRAFLISGAILRDGQERTRPALR